MIRAYEVDDLKSTANVWLRSGRVEYSYLPEFQKLDQAKAVEVFRMVIQDQCNIWVFEKSDVVVGFLAMEGNLIDRLYVDPEHQKKGIGSDLIAYAKEINPDGLVLRTHEQNSKARNFYEQRGFKPVRYGLSPPPESMPDIEYRWSSDSTA